jgi:phosphoribosylamine--glycine ligase
MMRMDTDLLPILLSCSGVAGWSLKDCRMRWSSKSSVVLVLAAPGYPGNPHTGEEIEGLPLKAEYDADCLVFYAGILRNAQGRPVTAGGRVLNIVATGEGYKQAGGKIYTIVESKKIHFPNMLYRKDIAA